MSTTRILHVEDDRLDQELVRDALQAGDGTFAVNVVGTLEAFRQQLTDPQFDCIVSDIHLLGFDGLQVLDLARDRVPHVPFVFMTGTGSEELAVEAMKRGADDYIIKKPSHIIKLPTAIRAALARRQTEAALRLAEERLRLAAEAAGIGCWDLDLAGNQLYLSPIWKRQIGYRDGEIANHPREWADRIHPEDRERMLALTARVRADPSLAGQTEYRLRHKDGSYRWILAPASFMCDAAGQPTRILGVNIDITERKLSELHLQRVNRALRVLSDCNIALVRAATEQSLVEEVCGILTEAGGYLLAWVAQATPAGSVRVAARSGEASACLDGWSTAWDNPEHGQDPTCTAMRLGERITVADFESGDGSGEWRGRAARFGLRSCIALPLRHGGRVVGALTLYSGQASAPDADEAALLDELAGDLAYGIAARRTEAERDWALTAQRRSQQQFSKVLEDAIQAIATAAEMRDAYTAGHQRRVADLAVAIAEEMGLSRKLIHGLRLAAVVHDIGKITVPAEVLSKPTRLSPIELTLIRTHSQAGFDILKGIDFPWPIAQIVLQHHERLNGQGYPDGLRGDQILLEARILAVADTVEAMASHRPYRPSQGIDVALGEIASNAGVIYDPKVAEACLRLFRDKGYGLPA